MITRPHSPLLWLTAFTVALVGHATIALGFASGPRSGGPVPSATGNGQPLAITLAASGASRQLWQAARPVVAAPPAVSANPPAKVTATATPPQLKPPKARATTVTRPAVARRLPQPEPQPAATVAATALATTTATAEAATPSASTTAAKLTVSSATAAGDATVAPAQTVASGGSGGASTATGATTGNDEDELRRARQLYFAQLSAWLKRHQEYPETLKQARQQGTVVVRFTVDRQGQLLASSIKHSSGHSQLDQAALALLVSASPLPPLPDELTQQRITLAVPIDYSLSNALVASRSTP